jgi:hypothetical protein
MSGANTSLTVVADEQLSGIEDDTIIPDKALLISNYPNPFNGSTLLKFNLPAAGKIGIDIYNIVGQKVETIFEGDAAAGELALTWDASRYPSGIYFCRLTTAEKALNHRITLIK